ncbi:MAG: hypothetical protein FD135_3600 [Comamonadaceae bacterium]|nr:MAG: hypothetical protein FD135_3600 [Comamonadaceae bacterium]
MNTSNFEPVDLSRATNTQLDLVNACFVGDAPQIWRDMAELNFVALRFVSIFAPLSDEALAEMSVNLVHQLVDSFGGTQPYIPSGFSYHMEAIAVKILKEFDGKNLRQLARKYKRSEGLVYKLIRADAAKKKHQSKAMAG